MKTLLSSPFADRTFMVGGCVRDRLLGIPATDIDYVVEATKEDFEGHFELDPVGNDFPVYIIEGNEVALTRREKSTGKTYSDFEITAIGVDIETDLSRRDFTMNSIAVKLTDGTMVDPFNGVKHIKDRKIVTVNEVAFEEDPVRILRAFRFAAKFGFDIDDLTMDLMVDSVENLEHVTKERVVLEIEKTYKQVHTGAQLVKYFELMLETGALEILFPPVAKLATVTAGPHEHHHGKSAFEHTMDVIARVKDAGHEFHIFMAALFHDTGKGVTPVDILPHHYEHEERSAEIAAEFLSTHRFSAKVKDFVPKAAAKHMRFHLLEKMSPKKAVRLVHDTRLDDFKDMVKVAEADHPFSAGQKEIVERLVATKTMKFDTARIAKSSEKRSEVIGQMVSHFKHLKRKM